MSNFEPPCTHLLVHLHVWRHSRTRDIIVTSVPASWFALLKVFPRARTCFPAHPPLKRVILSFVAYNWSVFKIVYYMYYQCEWGFLYGHNFYVHIATCFACCLTLPVFKINIISQTPLWSFTALREIKEPCTCETVGQTRHFISFHILLSM